MKVGDLVRHRTQGSTGLVVDMTAKRVARTTPENPRVKWSLIEPETHAVVMFSYRGTICIPVIDLEIIK